MSALEDLLASKQKTPEELVEYWKAKAEDWKAEADEWIDRLIESDEENVLLKIQARELRAENRTFRNLLTVPE